MPDGGSAYPTPTRGTTLGRFCITCGLAPPRPIGIPPPAPAPPPIGIGIIGMPPPPAGAPAPAIAAALGMPIPDIAEVPIRDGIEPCQVCGLTQTC